MNAIRELVTVLRYTVDQSGLRKYQTAYREAIGKIGAGVRNVRDFGLGFVDGVRQGIGEVMVSQRALNAAQAQGTREVQQMGQGYRSIAGVVRSIVAGVSVISAARIADEWASVEGRVGLATSSVQEQKTALEEIYAIAQRARQEYTATGDLFQKVQRNAKDLGLELRQSLGLTEIIAKTMTIGGGDTGSQQAALMQLGQALGSGSLRGDELNSIIEQAPRLAEAIAEAFGVRVGELRDLGKAGKLTSKQLAEGLLKQADKINAEFERMPKTFGGAMVVLKNALGREIASFNKATGAAETFAGAVALVARNLRSVLVVIGLIGASWGLVRLRAALVGATGSATLLQAAMVRLRALSIAALWPYLRMAALLTSLYLIGEDILVWLRGGVSVTGGLIGRVEEWQEWIDRIRDGLAWIKDQLGGLNDELGPWLRKWGTIGVLILGLSGPLFRVLQLVFTLGKGLLFLGRGFGLVLRLAWMLVAGLAAVVGWPALLVAAVVAAVAAAGVAIYKHWDGIKKWGADAWNSITAGAGAAYDSIVAWIKGIGESISTWITGKLEEAKSMFSNLAPDWLKTGASWVGRNVLGVGAADVQRAGATTASVTVQNNVGGVTVNAPNANPATVAAATQRGVSGALAGARASTAGVAVPMVEAMP
ncbi:tape measure protein [Cupriavidus gilardii]|uniref:tape measure protein n=1 Tax=Cupriavidus gilardii TaxID=82541 RepID=UPI00352E9E45